MSDSTTIRISKATKERLENLEFVRKHTFDKILSQLMDMYEEKE
jgi:predicted DNA-binding protein